MDSQSSIPSHISRWIPSCPVDSPQSYRLDRRRSALILAHRRGTLTRDRRESSDPRTTSLYCTIPPPHPPSGSSNLRAPGRSSLPKTQGDEATSSCRHPENDRPPLRTGKIDPPPRLGYL